MVICFLGCDGVGKSTIIDELISDSFSTNSVFHLKPMKNCLQNTRSDNALIIPRPKKPYGKFRSYLKILYLIIQYNLGWLINVARSKKKLIIFDRYLNDILVDPDRFRYSGSSKVSRFAMKLIPKPQYFFVLIADEKVILSRKQELSLSLIKKMQHKYLKLVEKSDDYFLIDANKDIGYIKEMIKNYLSELI